jgi:hypothetical protein
MGNLWDMQTAYNVDGVHDNSAGHGQIADALATRSMLYHLLFFQLLLSITLRSSREHQFSHYFSDTVAPQSGSK